MWLCHQVTFESLLADSSLGQAHELFGITCGSSSQAHAFLGITCGSNSHENPKPPVVAVNCLNCVWFFVTPWTAAHQAHLSSTLSQSLLKHMSIELVMPSNHIILCCLLLWFYIFPNIRVFPSESSLRITWPKYWNFKFSISPSNEDSGLISLNGDI